MFPANRYGINIFELKKQAIGTVLAFFVFLCYNAVAAAGQPTVEQLEYIKKARALWDSLDRRNGKIKLPSGIATLNVPETFYYLGPADAEKVLVQAWGNPSEASKHTLGMLFSSGLTPFDSGVWGVTIEYQEDGHVSDKDANEINYDDLLSQMQESTREASKARVRKGYEPIELLGWAAKPYYDRDSHKLLWAKELKIGDDENHTLNYNIRVLGRKGVLVLNFIAGMDQKALISSNLDTVVAMTNFDEGNKYSDFNPDMDTIAAYGIGALVAGKMLAKTGLIAAALIFLKKFAVIIFAGLGALFKGILSRKKAS